MSDDAELFDFLDDLEAEAESLAHRDRMGELVDRRHSEYHEVSLAARLMASRGQEVALEVRGVGPVRGELARVGPDWCAVERGPVRWVVSLRAVGVVRGASSRAVPTLAWGAADKLGLRSRLRRLADSGDLCTVHLVDSTRLEVCVVRVGADFVEVRTPGGESLLIASRQLAAVRHPG